MMQEEVEVATGLTAPTLRVLARRFGIPPGHQGYVRADLVDLGWISDCLDAGLSLPDSVTLWRANQMPGDDPATPLDHSVGRQVTEALLRYDMRTAASLVEEVLAVGRLEDVLIDVVQRCLVDLGDRWECGEATVEQEHYTTNFFRGRLMSWIHTFPSTPVPPARVIAACAPEEQHEIGLLILSLLLQIRGWSICYLGQKVPGDRLAEAISAVKPDAVLFSSTRVDHARLLAAIARSLPSGNVHLFFGGQAFADAPDLVAQMPGTVLLGDARSAVTHIESAVLGSR